MTTIAVPIPDVIYLPMDINSILYKILIWQIPFSISFWGPPEAVSFYLKGTIAYHPSIFVGLFKSFCLKNHNLVYSDLDHLNISQIIHTFLWGKSCKYHRCFRRHKKWQKVRAELQKYLGAFYFSEISNFLQVWSMLDYPLQSERVAKLWNKKYNDKWGTLVFGDNIYLTIFSGPFT